MPNYYATLEELKARLGISDSADDALLEMALESVSRYIDDHCRTRFYSSTADETRYFTAAESCQLLLDIDLISVTGLYTDADGDRVYESTWASTQYDLYPYNAALDGRPYWRIDTVSSGTYSFPVGVARGVKISGRFGFCQLANCPAPIKEVCLVIAAQMWRLKQAPFGVSASPEMAVSALDPSQRGLVLDWMAPYKVRLYG